MVKIVGFAGGAAILLDQTASGGGGSTDDVADSFTFNDQFNVGLGSTRASNTITVSGLGSTVSVAATLSGSTSSMQSINGGAFQSSAGVVVNGDTITVQHYASTAGLTQTDTTLTLGASPADTFSSVTASTIPGGSIAPIAATFVRRRFN